MNILTVRLDEDQLTGLAADVAERLSTSFGSGVIDDAENRWMNSREAAAHLGISLSEVQRLSAASTLPSEQDGPGCKRYFKRRDLDAWRLNGGRSRPR